MASTTSSTRPENVGILALEMYFPTRFVEQTDLEAADGCKGKYTVGLGQERLAFVDDREDIGSVFLTVTQNLLEKYNIDPNNIGRLEVGTETLTDKSKSIKTTLMQLFGSNTDIEGVTSYNACYGGIAALLNSIAWVESSEWDGRFALLVCGDIAVYEAGPARPTGGCGAIAVLIGPDAPLAMDAGVRGSHFIDCYDFYKPNHSEYPVVDGVLSQAAYLSCVDNCYRRYKEKFAKKHPGAAAVTADHFDFAVLHSPYNKLTQKGYGRLQYVDAKDSSSIISSMSDDASSSASSPSSSSSTSPALTALLARGLTDEQSYTDREVDAVLRDVSAENYKQRCLPAARVGKQVGNSYTGSVFAGLVSLVSEVSSNLVGKRVAVFSYGSGSASTLYSLQGRVPTSSSSSFTLERMASTIDVFSRLSARTAVSVDDFSAAMSLRQMKYGQAPMHPDGKVEDVPAGSYYLVAVDEKHRRTYARRV